jgi:catechol 2,3-dioxygenase-like lactoylglutathione lyase family enzyme
MPVTPFAIQRIDHIKVLVPDRYIAASGYERVFGFRILHGSGWDMAANIPGGPLFLGIDDTLDSPKIALLEGEPLGNHAPVGLARASFSVAAPAFLTFLGRLDELNLVDESGEILTRAHLVDQWIAWSFYFSDPYGNRYELTTYDYQAVQTSLVDQQA